MKLTDTLTKKIAIGMFAVGTYFGSIHNTEGFWPFYTKITGKNYGINVAISNQIEKDAEFYGLQLNFAGKNYGTVNGVSLGVGVITKDSAVTNGLHAGLFTANEGTINGASLGILNVRTMASVDDVVNGVQLGVFNGADNGNYVQVGIFNETPDKLSMLLNSYFNNEKRLEK